MITTVGCFMAAPATASTLSSDIETSAITICQAAGTLTVNTPLNAGPTGTIRLQSGGGVTQSRSFVYDNRGFLTSETQPEKGAATPAYRFDIRLQGDGETVFFDL